MFNVGDRVLVLLLIPGEILRAKFCGPCTIDEKVSDVDYIVCTPDKRKTMRMCHVNMLKGYHVRDDTRPVFNTVTNDTCDDNENSGDDFVMNCDGCDIKLENADILSNLESKVSHLEPSQQCMYPVHSEFQVRLKQCNIVPAKPNHCTVCGVEFQPNCGGGGGITV